MRKCPVCGNEKNTKLHKVKLGIPAWYQLPEEYHVAACEECGFCFADTKATQEDYDNYYSNCNSYSGTPVGEEAWSALNQLAIEYVESVVSLDDKLLDMGFGKGSFLRCLKEQGYSNIYGIDPSPESVAHIQKYGIAAKVGSIAAPPAKEDVHKYKCVFLFDVLEHLLYPKEAIIYLKHYLQKDGYLLLSVPNYAALKHNNHPISNVFNQEHINYFSPLSLDNLMISCGFERKMINAEHADEKEEIVVLYQWKEEASAQIKRDEVCVLSIEEYLQRFLLKKKEIEQKLEKMKSQKVTELYVWGTGAYTMWLLANTILPEFSLCFIDNNVTKRGQEFYHGIINSPAEIKDSKRVIVICSMLYADVIEKQIREMGLDNRIEKI